MVCRDVRVAGCRGSALLLQAGHNVRIILANPVCCSANVIPNSIQTWAMKEARARMEARGEKTDYP